MDCIKYRRAGSRRDSLTVTVVGRVSWALPAVDVVVTGEAVTTLETVLVETGLVTERSVMVVEERVVLVTLERVLLIVAVEVHEE